MHVGCWRFFKVVEHVVTHDGWMDGWRKHEGAFFLRKSQLSLQSAPQLDPRWTRSGTTSSLIFR